MDRDGFDRQLDALLAQRAVPEMRSNLAYRIIEASKTVPQERLGVQGISDKTGGFFLGVGKGLVAGVLGVLDCVALPKPAFAMLVAVIMVGGIALGNYTGKDASSSSAVAGIILSDLGYSSGYSSSDVETFVMATDSFEYGDFL